MGPMPPSPRTRQLALLSLFALALALAGCAETRTYTVDVVNETRRPLTVGLVKEGGPYERQWASPEEAAAHQWTDQERRIAEQYRATHVAGAPEQVRRILEARAAETNADEVMVFTSVFDPADRLRSYELLASAFEMTGDGRG